MFGEELNKWISAAELFAAEPNSFGKAEALFEYGSNILLNPITHSKQLLYKEEEFTMQRRLYLS